MWIKTQAERRHNRRGSGEIVDKEHLLSAQELRRRDRQQSADQPAEIKAVGRRLYPLLATLLFLHDLPLFFGPMTAGQSPA